LIEVKFEIRSTKYEIHPPEAGKNSKSKFFNAQNGHEKAGYLHAMYAGGFRSLGFWSFDIARPVK
jgi:hypothetical protein